MNGTSKLRQTWGLLVVSVRRSATGSQHRSVWVLVAALIVICGWQYGFSRRSAFLDSTYRNAAASGVHDDGKFVYFLYYLNVFPVATTLPNPPLREEGARSLLVHHPSTLVQDLNWTWFEGDRGKILPYLFDAWLKGEPRNPSVRPFNRLAFTLALCALFASLWLVGQPLLGGFAVLFLGSNPFQLYEVHARENVHGWTITIAVLMLALHVPALARRRPDSRYLWLLPVMSGVLLGTVRTIRSEPVAIIVSAAVAYACLNELPWRRRSVMVAALAASFVLTNAAWNRWFVSKHEEAKALLTRVGGHPFPGPIRAHHAFWHPIWCGLGDFGQKYGYAWRDEEALAYAAPILEEKYDQTLPRLAWDGDLPPEEYWDERKVYKKLPFDVPHYGEVLRSKILRDVSHDPLWYAGVLARRLWRIVFETTPVRVAVGTQAWTVPMHGLLLFPLAAMLYAAGSRLLLGMVLFTLPTCLPALIVFSGMGMTYYGVYQALVAAVGLTLAIENFGRWTRQRRTPQLE